MDARSDELLVGDPGVSLVEGSDLLYPSKDEMEIDVGDAERELNQTVTEQDDKSTFVRLLEDPGVFVFRDQQFFRS